MRRIVFLYQNVENDKLRSKFSSVDWRPKNRNEFFLHHCKSTASVLLEKRMPWLPLFLSHMLSKEENSRFGENTFIAIPSAFFLTVNMLVEFSCCFKLKIAPPFSQKYFMATGMGIVASQQSYDNDERKVEVKKFDNFELSHLVNPPPFEDCFCFFFEN